MILSINRKDLNAHQQIFKKRCFEKFLFISSSMPIFSFIGYYTLTELFRKPDNSPKIYKQMSSTFYTSNDVSRRKIISTS